MELSEIELYDPPENFSMIEPGLFRSSFPAKKNFSFLKKLKLKTILTLVMEEYPKMNRVFMDENGIKLMQFGVAGNKEPFVDIPEEMIINALSAVLDKNNHPLLIHCNKGKHRTGSLVGCVRRAQCWGLTSIFAEYRFFADPKARFMDQQFIELFNVMLIVTKVDKKNLPNWPGLEWLSS